MMDIRSRVKVVSRRLDTTKDNVGHMQGCRDCAASARFPWRLQHLHRQGRFRWRSDERPVRPLLVSRHRYQSSEIDGAREQLFNQTLKGYCAHRVVGPLPEESATDEPGRPRVCILYGTSDTNSRRTLLMSESPSVNQAAEFSPRRGVTSINAVRRSPARYRAGWQ